MMSKEGLICAEGPVAARASSFPLFPASLSGFCSVVTGGSHPHESYFGGKDVLISQLSAEAWKLGRNGSLRGVRRHRRNTDRNRVHVPPLSPSVFPHRSECRIRPTLPAEPSPPVPRIVPPPVESTLDIPSDARTEGRRTHPSELQTTDIFTALAGQGSLKSFRRRSWDPHPLQISVPPSWPPVGQNQR